MLHHNLQLIFIGIKERNFLDFFNLGFGGFKKCNFSKC